MTYSAEVLADSPVVYFRLGESSGTTMADSSGNGRDGVYENGPILGTPGLIDSSPDTAMSLTQTSDRGLLAAAAMPTITGTALTIEAWFKPTNLTGDHCIVNRASFASGVTANTYAFDLMTSGTQLRASVNAGGSYRTFKSASGVLTVGDEYHAVLTYDGTTLRAFVNTVEVITQAVTGSLASGQNVPLTIGIDSTPQYFHLLGVVDEVAVYDTALSTARIAAHYDAATAPAPGANDLILTETLPALVDTLVLESYTDTDTRNQVAGLTIVGSSIEPDDETAVILPAAAATRRDKALWYPDPDLVDGRPT